MATNRYGFNFLVKNSGGMHGSIWEGVYLHKERDIRWGGFVLRFYSTACQCCWFAWNDIEFRRLIESQK